MKRFTFLFLMVVLAGSVFGETLNYRFDYKIESDVRKRMYLLYKFKMYYKAKASALFSAKKTGENRYEFNLKKLQSPSYRIRTHRKGSKLSIVTAGMTIDQAKKQYPIALADFKNSAPYYWNMNKTISRRPFKILPLSSRSLSFVRLTNGLNKDFVENINLVKPNNMNKYNDSFNLYRLMGKMLKLYDYTILPGGSFKEMIGKNHSWQSKKMNYTKALNGLSHLADFKSDKYVKFIQKQSFRLKFSLDSMKNGVATIFGIATPKVSVGMGLKIKRVIRKIRIRLSDEVLLQDYFYLDAKDKNNRGWSFVSNLKLL